MNKKQKLVLLTLLTAFFVLLAGCGGDSAPATGGGDGDDTTVFEFNLSSHDSPVGTTGQFLDAWSEAVNEASGGRIVIHNFHGGSLATMPQTLGMVLDGAIDLGWGLASFYPGVFPATDAIALPFIGLESPVQATHALWELYETTDWLKGEWTDAKVIVLHTNADTPLISQRKLNSAADLRGMNLRTNAGPATEWARLAGAEPVNLPIGEVYQALERGVIDGATSTGWDAVNSFRFYEQGDYFLDYALHVSPFFLIMNWDSYNRLPDDLKAIIDAHSGYGAIDIIDTRWADVKASVREIITDRGGEIYNLPPAEHARLVGFAEQAREMWKDSVRDAVDDVDGLVEKAMELMEKHSGK